MTFATVEKSLPKDFEVHEELGKGSNNKALRVQWKGKERIMRVPRRRSDTQQQGSARWECMHATRAAQLGVGPQVVASWFSRHRSLEWPSGLYMVMEHFPYTLDDMFRGEWDLLLAHKDAIGRGIVHVLEALAREGMFAYDLKPSNVVLRVSDEGAIVRIIDYGRDFCEWKDASQPDVRTPTIDLLHTLCEGSASLMAHILFSTMLVQLSCTTVHHLYEDRHDHKLGRTERGEANPIVQLAARHLESMQGRHLNILRRVFRTDEVRGVMRHYHGRRDAGTRRVLRAAATVL